jgi:hypothetical protein
MNLYLDMIIFTETGIVSDVADNVILQGLVVEHGAGTATGMPTTSGQGKN